MAQMVKNLPACGRPGFNPWFREIPWRRAWQTHSRILACRIPMDKGVWWAKFHGVAESQMQLSTAQHMYIHWQFHYVYLHLNISSKALFTFPEEENGVDGNITCKQIKLSIRNKCCNWSFRNGQPTSKLTNCVINLVFVKGALLLWASISQYWTPQLYILL